MKIRNGFVSNSSSSSFVVAISKNYQLSEQELESIRYHMEDCDEYFSYYEEIAQKAGDTEMLDEREKIQKMLETGNFEEEESLDPVNDDVKNADIARGFEHLKKNGFIWTDSEEWFRGEIPVMTAANAIIDVISDKVLVAKIDLGSGSFGTVINILAENNDKPGLEQIQDHYQN